jgi:hypothetical protein
MSEFQLFDCDLKVPCDTFQCYNRAKYYVGKPDQSKGVLVGHICEKCATELVKNLPSELNVNESVDRLVQEVHDLNVELDAAYKRLKEYQEGEPDGEQPEESNPINDDTSDRGNEEGKQDSEEDVDSFEIDGKPLHEMNQKALRELCKELGITGYGKMTNPEMMEVIEAKLEEMEVGEE